MKPTDVANQAGLLCPVCRIDLVMSERQKIEIDYCPKCRGVWLDRGELDKIIERSAAEAEDAGQPPAPQRQNEPSSGHGFGGHGSKHGSGGSQGHGGHGGHGRRHESFFSRLFD